MKKALTWLFWLACFLVALSVSPGLVVGQQLVWTQAVAGTTSITGPDINLALNLKTMVVVVDVTTLTGTTPTITPVVQFKDAVSGKYIQWHANFTAISAVSTNTYLFGTGTGAAAGGITATTGFGAPGPTFRVLLTYGGTVTASAGNVAVYESP